MTTKKGETRWVILINNLAFKIPSLQSWGRFLNGLLNNLSEIKHRREHGVCPIHFWIPGGWLVVMPRTIPSEIVGDEGYPHWVERKPSSFGWLDGKLVAHDYGQF
jgi:hypothetical protein